MRCIVKNIMVAGIIFSGLYPRTTLGFSGHITSNTTWSDSVIVTGDVWVDAGVTLVIDSGTKIKFVKLTPLSHFYVNGTVLAQGTSNAPIYFTSYEPSPAPSDWKGVCVTTGSQNSLFKHCFVEYADTGVIINNASHHVFEWCVVRNNAFCGMCLSDAHYVDVFRTRVIENGSSGIVVEGSDFIVVDKRSFVCDNSNDGIRVQNANLKIRNAVIKGSKEGVVFKGITTFIDMSNCDIISNSAAGINCSEGAEATVSLSNIRTNGENGVVAWPGSGTGAYPTINDCNILENGSCPDTAIPTGLPVMAVVGSWGESNPWMGHAPIRKSYVEYKGNGYFYIIRVPSGDTLWKQWHNADWWQSSSVPLNAESRIKMGARKVSGTSVVMRMDSVRLCTHYQFVSGNEDVDTIDARYNWWGQITGIDTLIYQRYPGTVDYSGFQTSYISSAGLPNQLPVANAGPDQDSIDIETLVTLNGSGSFDPDTDLVYYHWSQSLTNPIYVSLSDSMGYTATHPVFTPDRGGDYVFILTVDDGLGEGNPDSVKIQVNHLPPDTFSLSLPNNGATVTTLTPTFVWNNTSDPEPGDVFTFTIWYSKDSTFATYTEVPGLTSTNYTPSSPLDDNSTYYWKIKAVDNHGMERWSNESWRFTTQQFGAEETLILPIPRVFKLSQNVPNPFIGLTEIEYGLPKDANVNLKIHDISGKLVRTLVDESGKPAYYSVSWDGKDNKGNKLGKGVYFIKFQAGKYKATKKLILVR